MLKCSIFTIFNQPDRYFKTVEQKPISKLKSGHNNIVTISASVISSDETLRPMDLASRNCLYKDETSGTTLYKNYTQSNCYFECFLKTAQKLTMKKFNSTRVCVPWFFPTLELSPKICNPWEGAYFLKEMSSVSTVTCTHCLPDCETTIYKSQV